MLFSLYDKIISEILAHKDMNTQQLPVDFIIIEAAHWGLPPLRDKKPSLSGLHAMESEMKASRKKILRALFLDNGHFDI